MTTPWPASLFLVVALLSSLSCVVEEASELGRECPCTEPAFVCCEGQCVEAGTMCEGVGECPGAVKISAFQVRWSTPNTIAFQWNVDEGSAETFSRYELVLGADAEAVRTREGVEVYDSVRNPELGFFLRPRETDQAEVTYTIADGLPPASPEQTGYFAQLTAFDNAGMPCRVALDQVNTSREADRTMELYTDATSTVGYTDPTCYAETSMGPHGEGESHRRYDVACERTPEGDGAAVCGPATDVAGTCTALIKMGDLNAPITLVPGDFASAFVEFQLRVPDVITYYGFVLLIIDNEELEAPTSRAYGFEPFVIRGGPEFQTIQIPLAQFNRTVDPFPPLTAELLSGQVTQFNWGSSNLPHGTEMHTDGVRIRWH